MIGKNKNKSKKQADSTGIYKVSRTATVEKGKYCLLALFLGWCGFHKFYEGRIITGAYYLLGSIAAMFIYFPLLIIPFLIGLRDLFRVINLPTDEEGNIQI